MRERLKNKKGYTLVELIVTFALTALFLGAAASVMGVFSKTYLQITTVAQGQTVASTILTTVTSELSSASDVILTGDFAATEIFGAAYQMGDENLRIFTDPDSEESDDSWAVYYSDYHHYSVKMYVDTDGYLCLDYAGTSDPEGNRTTGSSEWRLGSEVYNGFTITSLKIEQMSDTDGNGMNRLKASLILKNEKTGYTYTMDRSFECYNLTASKIQLPLATESEDSQP